MAPQGRITFDSIHRDVLILIVEQLYVESPASLRSFNRVCRAFYSLATPFIYRACKLDDVHLSPLPNERAVLRLFDNRYKDWLRELAVCFIAAAKFDWSMLVDAINGLKRLQSFRWEIATLMLPDELHHALQTRFPDILLHVSFDWDVVEAVGLGSALLNSSILRSVHTEIYGITESSPYWRGVKNIISGCRNVKILHICGYRNVADYFPFEEGDVWPPLEEMKFDRCNLDQAVMDKYSRYMDWDSVRYLEFGTVNHLAFFRALEGRLPNLRSYKLGPHLGATEPDFYPCLNRFLTTVGPLEELVIDSYDSDGTLELPTIVKHGSTLRSLKYHRQEQHGPRLKRDTFWSAEDLQVINEACPSLETFSLDVDDENEQPSDIHGALARFPRLRHLTLAMDILGMTRVNIDF